MPIFDVFFTGDVQQVSEAHRLWERSNAAFFKAIKKGDLQQIDQIIANYPEALNDWKTAAGLKSLHVALAKNNFTTFIHLLDRGALPNQKSEYNDLTNFPFNYTRKYSIFSYAAYRGKKNFCYALIERSCSTDMGNLYVRGWHKNEIKRYIEREKQIAREYSDRQKGILPSLPTPSLPQSPPTINAVQELEDLKTKYNNLAARMDATEKQLQETKERLDRTERGERHRLDKRTPDAGEMT
jgi:hypothetical protein